MEWKKKLWLTRTLELAIVAAIIYVFSYYFHNPFCGWVFACGCTFGKTDYEGWAHCNIHNVHGPYCPWCNAKKNVVWLIDTRSVDVIMFISYITVAIFQWRKLDQKYKTNSSRVLLVNNNTQFDDHQIYEMNSDDNAHHHSKQKLFYWKAIFKRIWVPFVVFTVYDLIMGIIFFVGTKYPYFMYWKRSK